jgi:hypothetical protein
MGLMVTILPLAVLDTEIVGKLYQVRRQVELYLKRLKSSLDRMLPPRRLGRRGGARDIICKLHLGTHGVNGLRGKIRALR